MTRSTVRSGYSAARALPPGRHAAINAAKAAPRLVPMTSSRNVLCIVATDLWDLLDVALARVVGALRRSPDQRRGLAVPHLGPLRPILVPGARIEIAEV